MIEKVKETVIKYNMIPQGGKVIVALSGGSDSVSLLYSMIMLAGEMHFDIEAAHVNHGIRENTADRDEAFVRETCNKFGIKLHVLNADVPAFAKKSGMTLEQAGRKIRYDFFESVREGGVVATAHNLDDRIETFIFNFTRGATLKGLCSIPPVRDRIIRPLINCTKEEILNFCSENNIGFVNDETNDKVIYSRNRIRHNVIPELIKINPGFKKAAFRCITSLNEDEEYLYKSALDIYENSKTSSGYDISVLLNAPEPLTKRVISIILDKEICADIDMLSVNSIYDALKLYKTDGTGTNIQLPDKRTARTRAGNLEFPVSINSSPKSTVLKDGVNKFGNYIISISVSDNDINNSQFVCKDLSLFFGDYDIIQGNLTARSRKAGDEITFLSRKITKSLRKIQNENKIPPEIRDAIPVIADEHGLLCAYGCGITSRFCVNEKTKRVIRIEITGDN